MATKVKHTYLGVVLATQQKEEIVATSQEAAKKEMKKLHGPEYGPKNETLWVCARRPGD
jgi:hypothetical protein